MPRAILAYIRGIDAMNRFIGRIVMYLVFVMIGVLMWSTSSKVLMTPANWTLETAQFLLVAYFVLGGPYSIQMGSNVRMDLFYGDWTPRTKAWVDAFTVIFLIFYLAILFYGGLSSLAYSLGYFGKAPLDFFGALIWTFVTQGQDAAQETLGFLERSPTAWRPLMWPIKLITCLGVFLMILQMLAEFFRDIGRLRGVID
ncbi:TRAP transporter small permease subunit [Roseovarius spongiae]|uniref:TRAP transporter small permease protein n=1 Tax=Roseovarius spongiae TaxID=2320272 RepID=A0A3A8B802_9RHOB|nr:TRAP transporter small permease subunit [Roseovarius spongiae]RKF13426.1 TRAP transporter small permease subunit [Roseovarius spongiae]